MADQPYQRHPSQYQHRPLPYQQHPPYISQQSYYDPYTLPYYPPPPPNPYPYRLEPYHHQLLIPPPPPSQQQFIPVAQQQFIPIAQQQFIPIPQQQIPYPQQQQQQPIQPPQLNQQLHQQTPPPPPNQQHQQTPPPPPPPNQQNQQTPPPPPNQQNQQTPPPPPNQQNQQTPPILLSERPPQPKTTPGKIFISGIGKTNQTDFYNYFSKFGWLKDWVILKDTTTQRYRGCGFVTYDTTDIAQTVIRQSPHSINGVEGIIAHTAQPKKSTKRSRNDPLNQSKLVKTKAYSLDEVEEMRSIALKEFEERYKILRSIIADDKCVDEELRTLLRRKQDIVYYYIFEPSGRVNLAQWIIKTLNVNKMASAGCKVKILIADWFAMLSNKMGGDMEKIKDVGNYLIETWIATGMNIEGGNVDFVWSSNEINARAHEYWPLVMDISKKNNVKRVKKCIQIMGQNAMCNADQEDELNCAQIFYTLMQCADIFFLKADICQLGMDIKEVNVLAREYSSDPNITMDKPTILSPQMLPGLEGQGEMSTSNPSSSIFMDDDEESVSLKIQKACCPETVQNNPCLEYIKYIVFPWFEKFTVQREPDSGGDKTFTCFEEVIAEYECGGLHPKDLKTALAKALNMILEPVRRHFVKNEKAKDLLERVKVSSLD